MILSQLLLTGFIGYWLFEQYHDKVIILRKDLTYQLELTQNQILDSIIQVKIVAPILSDSLNFQPEIEGNDTFTSAIIHISDTNSRGASTLQLNKTVQADTASGMKNIITVEVQNDSVSLKDFVNPEVPVEDILSRSIKLLITQTRNVFITGNPDSTDFYNQKSDSIIQKTFTGKLKKSGKDFNLHWLNSKSDSTGTNKPEIYIKSEYPLSSLSITGYRGHILGLMIPQLIFSFFLLSLTAFAFYFTYSNYKKQFSLNVLRRDFISNITHELKTPVTTVKVAIEALKSGELLKKPDTATEYLNMADEEVMRLEILISKIIEHARLESKTAILNLESTNLQKLIENVIDKFLLRSGDKISINYIPPSGDIFVDIDKTYITGVINTILDNSVKYAGDEVNIEILLQEDNNGVFLSIADDGPGIPEKYLPEVFDTFFRVPQGDRHNVKGYGLGLSFAKQVMNAHGGSISVRNLPQGGCVFTLKFKISK